MPKNIITTNMNIAATFKTNEFVLSTAFNLISIFLIALANRLFGMLLSESALISSAFICIIYQVLKAEGISLRHGSIFDKFTIGLSSVAALFLGLCLALSLGIE